MQHPCKTDISTNFGPCKVMYFSSRVLLATRLKNLLKIKQIICMHHFYVCWWECFLFCCKIAALIKDSVGIKDGQMPVTIRSLHIFAGNQGYTLYVFIKNPIFTDILLSNQECAKSISKCAEIDNVEVRTFKCGCGFQHSNFRTYRC